MATAAHASAVGSEAQYEPVSLAGKYEILPDSPLPPLNALGGPAFAVRGLRDRKLDLFAVVCNSGLPPRLDVLNALRGVENPALMCLVDYGVVDWAPEGARRFVLILEKPAGRRLMSSLGDTRDPMTEDQLIRQVMQPLCIALKELSSRGIVHGEVRPTNLFLREQGGSVPMLGECISSLPSYGQSNLLLTIERAMAQPGGRGPGSAADDLYALGVTALVLLLGHNPVKQAPADEEQVLQAKIERGSFPSLVGAARVPVALMEPLRGLLNDDPKQRWTVDDLDLWLNGRRLSPKQPLLPRKAARPFNFGGGEHWHCRSLARAFSRHAAAAAPLIESGELDRWLRRSLADEARADAVGGAIATAGIAGRGGSQEERLVARVAMALDPSAPIRYKQKAMMVDGFGSALAEMFALGESPQPVAEMIIAQLPMFWVNVQPEFRPEHVPLVQTHDALRALLERPGTGFGIERVLYELNPLLPCMSPMFRSHFVLSPADLLTALDQIATRSDRPREPIDRHVAAFLAVRHRKHDERLLGYASGADSVRRISAILNALADVQRRFGPPNLPHLCAWLVTLIEPAIERFHHRPQRVKLRGDIERAARDGDLTALTKLIDNPTAIHRDELGFAQARRSHQKMSREIDRLRREIDNQEEISEILGRQVAAVASSVLSAAVLAAIVAAAVMFK